MDAIFGEVDAVEAGERVQGTEKVEALAISSVEHHEDVSGKQNSGVTVNSGNAV